ncbi:molybdopterin molybdenumtransferase MoeA [Pedobacter petrophilus]|uniref:Molybdopterin molybdenumtransferase n=1 Tax=Pedobacter petrophilus TaxID=1908241 RepID=A0A7K0G2Y9_9SPHI|nr:gephyrin-like molybdotransferase Glp [Pedobacter petrophilus]MRX77992.1 molybdopterin molybdenumtransferase MoeA [Pedobacter petrophilus]
MITVEQAKQIIADSISHLEPVNIPLNQAARHILAADIYATFDIPAFRQSSMDGYAIKYEESLKTYTLVGEMAAGASQPLTIRKGETSRIFTGAPLPDGADTVIMQEKISRSSDQITIEDPKATPGLNVREKGAEIKAGVLAMQAGSLLTPAALGFLAGIGICEVTVFPMPKVSIILTGNELQQPGKPLAFGQVYESNSYSLSAALKLEGVHDIAVHWVNDNLESLTEMLHMALDQSDVVLLTGGVSVGDYDYVIAAAEQCGIDQQFHKIKQKPGKPLYFGTKDQKLVFGLPGNPSSVLSCYYNYVLPAIKSLSKLENSVRELEAELEVDYEKPIGLTHFLKGIYTDGKVTPLNAQESFRLSSFAQSNCLIRLNEDQQHFIAGDTVMVALLPH